MLLCFFLILEIFNKSNFMFIDIVCVVNGGVNIVIMIFFFVIFVCLSLIFMLNVCLNLICFGVLVCIIFGFILVRVGLR